MNVTGSQRTANKVLSLVVEFRDGHEEQQDVLWNVACSRTAYSDPQVMHQYWCILLSFEFILYGAIPKCAFITPGISAFI